MTNNDPLAPRVLAYRIFNFSRMATIADLHRADRKDQFLLALHVLPTAKQN